jgi:uncharacterized membrane protein
VTKRLHQEILKSRNRIFKIREKRECKELYNEINTKKNILRTKESLALQFKVLSQTSKKPKTYALL